MLAAGLTGGAVVALAVRSDDGARAELPPVAKTALIDPDGRGHLTAKRPFSALLEVWSLAQWGDVPKLLRLQDPNVRRSVGDDVIAGVYSHQRSRMASRRPRILGTEVRGQTATVRYRLQGEPGPILPQLAILRRQAGVWRLRYDTFVEDALPFYILAARGGDTTPERGDRLAAAREAAAYRNLSLKLAGPPTRPTVAANPPAPSANQPAVPANPPAAPSSPDG